MDLIVVMKVCLIQNRNKTKILLLILTHVGNKKSN